MTHHIRRKTDGDTTRVPWEAEPRPTTKEERPGQGLPPGSGPPWLVLRIFRSTISKIIAASLATSGDLIFRFCFGVVLISVSLCLFCSFSARTAEPCSPCDVFSLPCDTRGGRGTPHRTGTATHLFDVDIDAAQDTSRLPAPPANPPARPYPAPPRPPAARPPARPAPPAGARPAACPRPPARPPAPARPPTPRRRPARPHAPPAGARPPAPDRPPSPTRPRPGCPAPTRLPALHRATRTPLHPRPLFPPARTAPARPAPSARLGSSRPPSARSDRHPPRMRPTGRLSAAMYWTNSKAHGPVLQHLNLYLLLFMVLI